MVKQIKEIIQFLQYMLSAVVVDKDERLIILECIKILCNTISKEK